MTKRLRNEFDPCSGYEEPYIYAATAPPVAVNRQPPSFFVGSSQRGVENQSLRPSNSAHPSHHQQQHSNFKEFVAAPVQKRMRMNHDVTQRNYQNEGKEEIELVQFIQLAQDLGKCVVKHQDIDRALDILRGLRHVLSEERDRASRIKSGDSRESPGNLSDNVDLHWVNNFLFLQIGYLSSFKQNSRVPLQRMNSLVRSDVQGGSQHSRGPWSEFASRIMEDTVQTLVVLHEYNYTRRCLANNPPKLHAVPTRGTFSPLQLSIQLSEAESRECGNILCKFMRRTLDKMAYAWSKGDEINDKEFISSLQAGVNILDLIQKSMFTTRPVLRNDDKTLETLVRIIADLSCNTSLTSSTRCILDQSTSLLRTLSSGTNFSAELPLSEYATICSDIIIACSPHRSIALGHTWHSFNHSSDSNHGFFFSFLEKLRIALHARDASTVRQKWHMLFRTIEIMLKTTSSGERVVKTILTVINYLSMSRHIVRLLADDKAVLTAISIVATKKVPSFKQKLPYERIDIKTAAMQSLTSLATKVVKFCPDHHSGCLNVVGTLFGMAKLSQAPGQMQGEIVKGLRLFVGRNLDELDECVRSLPELDTKEILQLLSRTAASKQHSRSIKEAAVTVVVELYFHQTGLEDASYAYLKEVTRLLLHSNDMWGEEFIIKQLVGKVDSSRRENLVRLADNVSFLTSVITIASNEKHASYVRDGAMKMIKELSSSPAIGRKLAVMKEFIDCVLNILSVDVVGENCVLYKHYALEAIAIVGKTYKEELADRQLIKALLSFTRKLPSDYDSYIAKKQKQNVLGDTSKLDHSMKSQLQKLVEGLVSTM